VQYFSLKKSIPQFEAKQTNTEIGLEENEEQSDNKTQTK